jgi:DNA mismatch repair protein MutS2
MHDKSLHTLEYPKIIGRLADHCAFSASRQLAIELMPATEIDIVRHRLNLTTQARDLLDQRPETSVRAARDIRQSVILAERSAVLSPEQLIEIQMTLRSSAYLNRILGKLDESKFPLLRRLGVDLPIRQHLDDRIDSCITDEGTIRDTASPRLHELRTQLRIAQSRLQDRLNGLVNEFRSALQENLITMREGRYVLPVRAESRGQVKGIVHDQSGSGATLFIEPLVIVEMNNRLREIELEERREIERILRELSEEVARDAAYCTLAVELLAEIDLQFAKARYSQAIKGNPAKLNERGFIRLVDARHPLLTGKVIPLNFNMGDKFSEEYYTMVVITGPNTGGKTVALKTVGLLSLMTNAGLHIPADERSEMPIYGDIFADIGDEQSIEQSLSTFSSHMTRIIEILQHASSGSLVLLDELGAGTDPTEGSALARAILLILLERGASCVATTHYAELKAFAHEQSGVMNASVEFDVETLSPTYRLSIGIPGRSNALAIATRLGLDQSIIERARNMTDSTSLSMEQMLADIQTERKAATDERYHVSMERAAAEAEHRKLQDKVAELEADKAELERERVRIINQAREEARKQLQQLKSDIGRIRAESQRANSSDEAIAALRAKIRAVDDRSIAIPEPSVPRRPQRNVKRSSETEESRPSEEEQHIIPGEPEIGDPVRIISLGQIGELVGSPDSRGEAEVQIGLLKIRVKASELERLSRRKARQEQRVSTILPHITHAAPSMQLDLRGMRVEDIFDAIDQYLNDAYLGGLDNVRIVHGKGTGALRQAVREHLNRHPLVKSFGAPSQREGGEGVTEVVLTR